MEQAFDWVTLEADEEVLWSDKPHLYSIVPALVVGIPLSIVLIGIPIVVGAWLTRENTRYVVTTEGLYKKRGILSRDVKRIEYGKVQNTSFTQGPLGTYVGYGNVDISTAGSAGTEMQFRSVPDPKSVGELINKRIRDVRGRTNDDREGTDDVLEEILVELQTIRALVEVDEDGFERTQSGTATAEHDGE